MKIVCGGTTIRKMKNFLNKILFKLHITNLQTIHIEHLPQHDNIDYSELDPDTMISMIANTVTHDPTLAEILEMHN